MSGVSTLQDGASEHGKAPLAAIAATALVTLVDGFDAFSLSLMAAPLSADLNIPTAALGSIFASGMGGMILGGFGGGALADRFGRAKILMVALTLFGLAGLTMPFVTDATEVIVNRAIAGVGLGAAAPIGIALLGNSSGERPPSPLLMAMVWSCIGIGGVLASAFSYLITPSLGWEAIFVVGGILPLPIGLIAWFTYRHDDQKNIRANGSTAAKPSIRELFAPGFAGQTVAIAAMFLFGYISSSIVVNWLPTILHNRNASDLLISVSFALVSICGFLGSFVLGTFAKRFGIARTLFFSWGAAGICGFLSMAPALANVQLALVALTSQLLAVGSQSVSVALTTQTYRSTGLSSTAVGMMTSMGRIGQFSSLGLSGVLLAAGMPDTGVFALAGVSAAVAAGIALIIRRQTSPVR